MTTPRHHTQRHHQHARTSTSLLLSRHRVALLLVLLCVCVCASFFFVAWRPSSQGGSEGLATSASGHSYHPKLCTAGCGELHDPQLAQELVQLPPRGLQLLSSSAEGGDAQQLAELQHLLQTAVQQQWPLALARRVVSLLLQGAVPHVANTTGATTTTGPAALSAADSGHAAGWRLATQAVSLLQARSQGQLVPCSFDPSLPTDFHTRFLYAAAWPASSSGSGSVLANAVLQLLSAAALLPPGYAFVSVSVPTGAAADSLAWLDLLQLLAAPLGVPMHVAVQQPSISNTSAAAAGEVPLIPTPGAAAAATAAGASDSQALNAALAPFFPAWQPQSQRQQPAAGNRSAAKGQQNNTGRRLHQQQQQPPQQQQPAQLGGDAGGSTPADGTSSSGRISHGSCPAGRPLPQCYSPEFVVLLQPQLHFCAGDLLRLQEYPYDLVCGLQLDEQKPAELRHRHRHRRLQQQQQPSSSSSSSQAFYEGPMAAAVAAAAASQAVLAPEVPPEFELHSLRAAYDAAREITGDMLSAVAPYLSHTQSLNLARAGLPTPMYCCWGGLAKLKAAPLAAGLRFRAGEEDECHSVDPMSLMCDDLWRTGHSQILLDPGVRTSSQLRTKSLFEDPRFPFFFYTGNWETTSWFDIHPLLPLRYWGNTTAAAAPGNTTSSDAAGGDSGGDGSREVAVAGAAEADGSISWSPADWQPGDTQMCCEGQVWEGGAERFHHPTDCRRTSALSGNRNFTHEFLTRCAAGGC